MEIQNRLKINPNAKNNQKETKNYYGIALLINLTPLIITTIISVIGNTNDKIQKIFILFGIWELICAVVYSLYFITLKLNKDWHKIVGFVFPTIILSLILFIFPDLILLIIANLILNGTFILHWKKILANVLVVIKKLFSELILPTIFFFSLGYAIPLFIVNNFLEDDLIKSLLVTIFVLLFFAIHVVNNRNNPLVFQSPIISKYILWVLPFLAILVAFIIVFSPFPRFELNSFFYIIVLCLSIGLSEEIIFRGILFRIFQKTKFPIYLLVSAILFGLLHTSQGLIGVISATMGGLIFGLARISGFPLFLLIICHAIVDIPGKWLQYGDTSEVTIKKGTLLSTYPISLAFIVFLITIIYICIPKHWTNKLDKVTTDNNMKKWFQSLKVKIFGLY